MNNMRKYFFPFAVTCMMLLLMSGCKKNETFTVTFNANGGTGEMPQQTFTIGVAQALSTNLFTHENCIFLGWNTVQDGSGTAYSEKQEITIEQDITLYAQWMIPTGQRGGHYYVDLGLPSGAFWATCNVGAANPTDYGDYFAWGETESKDCYNWSTYKYYDQTGCNKYDRDQQILEVDDDVAAVNWGSSWRMPSVSKIEELCRYTTHTWTTINGINGMLVTGSNGNSIFLPAAGRYEETLSGNGISGYYWTNAVSISMDGDALNAWYLQAEANAEFHQNCYMYRYIGLPVRPIIENN